MWHPHHQNRLQLLLWTSQHQWTQKMVPSQQPQRQVRLQLWMLRALVWSQQLQH